MKPVKSYQEFVTNMQSGDGGAADTCVRGIFLRLAGDVDGITALAISSALRGEDPETAAANCGRPIEVLDRAIARFARQITAGHKKAGKVAAA